MKLLSRVRLFVTPWTVAYQAPPSMERSRQEYWSGLPFPSPGDLPDPGIKPRSPTLQADALPSEPAGKPWCFKPGFKSCVLSLAFINTREFSWEMMFQRNCIRYFHESSVCCSVLFNPLLRIGEWREEEELWSSGIPSLGWRRKQRGLPATGAGAAGRSPTQSLAVSQAIN